MLFEIIFRTGSSTEEVACEVKKKNISKKHWFLAFEDYSRKHLYNCNILFHFPNTVQTTSFLILYMVILIEYQFGPDHIQRVWNEKQILKMPTSKNSTFLWLDFIEHCVQIHIHLQLMLGPKWNLKKKVKKALLMTTIIESALMIVIFFEISQTLDLLQFCWGRK